MAAFRRVRQQRPSGGDRPVPVREARTSATKAVTTSGNASLDAVLGGGFARGSLVVATTDGKTRAVDVLCRQFCAASMLDGSQSMLVCAWSPVRTREWVSAVPLPAVSAPSGSSSDQPAQTPESHLHIAWQYRKYVVGGGRALLCAAAVTAPAAPLTQRCRVEARATGPKQVHRDAGFRRRRRTYRRLGSG